MSFLAPLVNPSKFNTGSDAKLALTDEFGNTYDLGLLESFVPTRENTVIEKQPISDMTPRFRDIPKGWRFSATITRANGNLDYIQDLLDNGDFYGGKAQRYFQITEFITNPNTGSVDRFLYTGVVLYITDAGERRIDADIPVKIEGRASKKIALTPPQV